MPTTVVHQCEHAHVHTLETFYTFERIVQYFILCFSRSSSFPYTDSSHFPQTTPSVTYYETSPTSGSQVTSPSTTQVASVTSGAVTGVASMFSEGSSGITVAAGASSSGMGGAGGVVTSGGVGSYMIPAAYMLGGGNQSFSQNTRASPATVSFSDGVYVTA